MRCKAYGCIYEDADRGECEAINCECIGDMCENYGECSTCQKQDRDECDR